MAATPKPHRQKVKDFVQTARKQVKKLEPNKQKRTILAKKGIEEHAKHASKGEKNRIKAMHS